MSRDLWPPKTIMIPISLLRDESIPNAACRLHLKLLALAWGGGLEMALSALLAAVSLSRTRLFDYARLLSLHGYLTWTYAAGVFKSQFADPGIPESRNPEKRDLTSLKSLNQDSIKIQEGGEIPENGIPEKRDSRARKPADPRTQSPEIQLFRVITGRNPSRVNYTEVIAAMQGRTREQLEPYYREWSARGHNLVSIKWLTDWAVSGQLPGQCGRKNGAWTNKRARSAPATAAKPQLSVEELRAMMRAHEAKLKELDDNAG